MIRRLAILCAAWPFWASPLVAESPVGEAPSDEALLADAFGLVPRSILSEERAAWAGVRLSNAAAEIVPPEAPETVSIFIGPKSLVAGADRGHAVALVVDRHGNLAEDGLTARFMLGGESFETATRDGVADVLFEPSTTAATYVAGAEVAGRQSTRASYRVTADLASLGPARVLPEAEAPSETVLDLTSDSLADRYGNRAEDGTLATILVAGADEATMIAAPVRDARVRGDLLLRDTRGGRITATIANRTDAGGAVRLAPAGYAGPVEVALWPLPEIGALGMRVGPVVTTDGYLLTDGAPVEVAVTAPGVTLRVEGWLRDGAFQSVLPVDAASGPFNVKVLTALGLQVSAVEPRPLELRVEVAE